MTRSDPIRVEARKGDPSDMDAGLLLCCPACSLPLKPGPDRLQCAQCGENWPVVGGVPHFVQNFPYWGEIPAEHMETVLAAAEKDWRGALVGSAEPTVRNAAQMIMNLDRANWHWLTDLGPQSRVLDIGAGMGANSHALGLRFEEVYAAEPVEERVRFMRSRFHQEKLTNVRIIRTSVWDLPFPAASFDLIAMNGVLEWVPTGRKEDPRELQIAALRRIHALLKPGGYFYLGIENRFTVGAFLGYPDPHCGLPFVTVLPRPCAHWYAKRYGQPQGYRNYLYSYRGYRQLLMEVGFHKVIIYSAIPSYNHPRFFVPLENNVFAYYSAAFAHAERRWTREIAHRVLQSLGILKFMEYSFAIIAQK